MTVEEWLGVFVVSAVSRCGSTATCSASRRYTPALSALRGCKHAQACARSSVKTQTEVRYFGGLRQVVSVNQAHHWEFDGWKSLVEVADQ